MFTTTTTKLTKSHSWRLGHGSELLAPPRIGPSPRFVAITGGGCLHPSPHKNPLEHLAQALTTKAFYQDGNSSTVGQHIHAVPTFHRTGCFTGPLHGWGKGGLIKTRSGQKPKPCGSALRPAGQQPPCSTAPARTIELWVCQKIRKSPERSEVVIEIM